MSHTTPYTAEAVSDSEHIKDIRIHINGKTWHLWGRNGVNSEMNLATKTPQEALPVLIGSGLGHCLKTLVEQARPIAVVDSEVDILTITKLKQQFRNNPDILWIETRRPEEALTQLTQWQQEHGGLPFHPIASPLYLRLNRPYYGALSDALKANTQADFWSQARYPKFQSTTPRVLFFDSNYFLCGEIRAALNSLGVELRTLQLDGSDKGSQNFIEDLLRIVIDFKPDFILTVNHFGLDREGKLAGLLNDLQLPLASWFVDNPHLILHRYAHPGTDNTAIFTYDSGNLEQMRSKGFCNVHYLPLATDPARFKPNGQDTPAHWGSDVSFVGNSMISPVAKSFKNANLPISIANEYAKLAARFGQSGETEVESFLRIHDPEWYAVLQNLPTDENKLALESLITWEATRQYRLNCVSGTLDFSPLIVGDEGWKEQLPSKSAWRYLSGLDYYEELPHFYPASKINFNCTSKQMPGAVNQRIFDVPACGGFVLTDYREQMEGLFDLNTEVATYSDPKEIPDLIDKYLKDTQLREKISRAAQDRILSEHTYQVRLTQLLKTMRTTF